MKVCATIGLLVAGTLALSACAQVEQLSSTETRQPSPAPSSTSTPDREFETQLEADQTSPALSCDQLLPLNELYDANPNLAVITGESESPSKASIQAVKLGATSCKVLNLSNNAVIFIDAVRLTPESASTLLASFPVASEPSAVGGNQPNTFRSSGEGISEIQIVRNNVWLIISSESDSADESIELLASISPTHI